MCRYNTVFTYKIMRINLPSIGNSSIDNLFDKNRSECEDEKDIAALMFTHCSL